MKLINYLLIAILLISSCKEDAVETVFDEKYGVGMYIVTDMGISFYNIIDSLAQVQNQIFKTVNNITINHPKKIKFRGTKAFIIGGDYIVMANINTFEDKGMISGFINPVDVDFISDNRLLVADKDDSKVKLVDIESMEITSDIETGDNTRPVFIVSNSKTSFIMNGGGEAFNLRDSTIISIDYRDNLVALADFNGSMNLGYNPNSAVIPGDLLVLCKGVYDPINPIYNTASSLSNINQYSNEVYSTENLSGIYNAQNLISNWNNSFCYLTAEGGVYRLNTSSLNTSLIVGVNASVINTVIESLVINDTTMVSYEMLYMNDTDSPNSIYKYNLDLSVFEDTIIVDGNVRGIAFYE